MTLDIGRELAALNARVSRMEHASRLASSSLDDSALEVRVSGALRGLVGQQADGTTAVNIVNGGPGPAPSTPTVAPALGGIAVAWDGTFAGGAHVPLDWSRVEVHASPTTGFTPTAATLQVTIETPQGAVAYVPATVPMYVVLLARNTSGVASPNSAQAGPYSPRAVVAGDVADGSITTTKIADNAITTPKVLAGAIDTAQLAALAITTAKLAAGSVDATALNATAITGKTITGGLVTGSTIQTAGTGQRITINNAGDGSIKVYDSGGVLTDVIGGINAAISQIAGSMQVSLASGGIYWDDLGSPGASPSITSDGINQITIGSGYAGGGGADLELQTTFHDGDSTLGISGQPRIFVRESTGVREAHLFLTGMAVRADASGFPLAWQIPSYNSNWGGSTTFNGSTNWGTLQFRLDVEDNVIICGAFKAGGTLPGNIIFQLPSLYRPTSQQPAFVQRNNGGTLSGGYAAISAAGNVTLLSASGMGVATGNEYLINATFPRHALP